MLGLEHCWEGTQPDVYCMACDHRKHRGDNSLGKGSKSQSCKIKGWMEPRNTAPGAGTAKDGLSHTWHMGPLAAISRTPVLPLTTYEALRWSLRLPGPAFLICDTGTNVTHCN